MSPEPASGGVPRKSAIRPAEAYDDATWALVCPSPAIGSARNWVRPTIAMSSPIDDGPVEGPGAGQVRHQCEEQSTQRRGEAVQVLTDEAVRMLASRAVALCRR